MDYHLITKTEYFNFNLNFDTNVVLIGSCFSDEMHQHFSNSGINTLSNPFGTLFHPIAIANCIEKAIDQDDTVDVYQRDDLFFSWDSSGVIYAKSEKELVEQVISKRNELREALANNALLVVTFGTSWCYEHKDLSIIVGNCHKEQPSSFNKKLSDREGMLERWSGLYTKLKQLNSELNIVFTVSPVRHKKDGLIENNRSKARLIEVVHELTDSDAKYFPAYEILIDELRDYRFYTKDLVHPNDIAVEEIWKRFRDTLFSEAQLEIMKRVENIKSTLSHKSLYPGSNADEQRISKANQQKEQLSIQFPAIFW